MLDDLWILLPVVLVPACWISIMRAARRFEARRRREGVWNESGPIDPTFAETNPTLRAVGIYLPRIETESGTDPNGLPELRPPSEKL